MRPGQTFGAEPSRAESRQTNREDSRAYGVSIWNRAFVNSGTKLRGVSGTPNINQKVFRIGLHTLST